ncbi:MAG: citrulline utilization hydrolase CtlX [Gammaproteobacteria bacterium]
MERQTTRYVFMVRPHHFGPNEQTAASNAFQQPSDRPLTQLREQALREFDAMTAALRSAGITPIVFEDTDEPVKPDAVFPNNWVSFHADGRVFLYPMEAVARRAERRLDIIEALSVEWGFRVSEIVDLSAFESDGLFLEGTGSMVLDRVGHVAYAALSSRTHMDALADFAQRADYEITAFEARDAGGQRVYHTNVMMALGEKFAVICSESIVDANKRAAVLDRIAGSGRDIVEITREQMRNFGGNLLELSSDSGDPVTVLSRRAHDSFNAEQRERISGFTRLLPTDVGTIERIGGGGARCMLGEIFLPLDEPEAVA